VAGEFSQWNGTPRAEPLIRLQADGSVDGGFAPVASGIQRVAQLVRLPGGAFLVWGQGTNSGTVRTVVQRRLPSGAIDSTFQPNLPESVVIHAMAAGDDGAVWAAGRFTEFDRASGPWVRLDSQGIADTNYTIRFSGTPQVYPRRSLRSASVRSSGGFLMNFQVTTPAFESVQRLSESGEIDGTSGSVADRMRLPNGPVLAVDEHSYLVPITVRETVPFGGTGPSFQSLGRFSLSALSASYTNTHPPRIVAGLTPMHLTTRAGFREPLVLSAVVQADPAARYRWYHREALIPDATGPSWVVTDPQPDDAGEYRLEVETAAGVARSSTVVTIVPASPDLPQLNTEWVGGERPLRIRFTPVPGPTMRWESSADLNVWSPVTDPESFLSEGELAPAVGTGPGYFRIVAVP
jgi:hypothetical protein